MFLLVCLVCKMIIPVYFLFYWFRNFLQIRTSTRLFIMCSIHQLWLVTFGFKYSLGTDTYRWGRRSMVVQVMHNAHVFHLTITSRPFCRHHVLTGFNLYVALSHVTWLIKLTDVVAIVPSKTSLKMESTSCRESHAMSVVSKNTHRQNWTENMGKMSRLRGYYSSSARYSWIGK